MNAPTRVVTGLLFGAVLLLTAGCTSATGPSAPTVEESAQPDPSPSATEDAPTPDEEPTGAPGSADPAVRAAEAALAARPGAVISVDPESGDVWSVLVRTEAGDGVELYVDAVSGEVRRERGEALPSAARSSAPAITAGAAMDIALGALSDGQIRELDLDTDRGAMVWEILADENGRLIEFYVDATTGDILKQEFDD